MKLSKQQINALAASFCKERNANYNKEVKFRETEARKVWDKTPDGKLFAKLPKWMQTKLEGWTLNEQVEKVWDGRPMPKKTAVEDVEREILIATIGATDVKDIMDHLKNKFK